jgi:hypothetical protein
MDYKIGSEYYIRDKRNDNPALTPPMIARLVGDKRWEAVKDIPGRSRVTLLKPETFNKVKFWFDGQDYETSIRTFRRFANDKP